MLTLITFTIILQVVRSGLITHSDDGHGKATSYQSINIEHFHPVPTHVKKEHQHLLEHPIPIGKSSSNLEVHHGDKHDHGYAIVDSHSKFHVADEHKLEEDSPHHEALQYAAPHEEEALQYASPHSEALHQYSYYTPKSLEHSNYQTHNSLASYSPHHHHQEEEEQQQHDYDQNDEVKLFFPTHGQDDKEDVQVQYHQTYYHGGHDGHSEEGNLDGHYQEEHQDHKRSS